ncbi:Hsp20/alpha crystallin family protein [Engelhardtia mirabilis]|uniref:18 kDa heat shock protein n=1 Tax=Engelhardtia mirabilis TaxID=2528011 RepID=A0A518BEQ7_9BACT|nr:18 kDa heat shock protein [Planctomycetes bacterium Pla133]QDU99787.1 18 kDa heat shock protein [Planctomycetes bacterium Pla86]
MKHLIPVTGFGPARADLDRLFERFFEGGNFSGGGEGRSLVRVDVAELTDAYQVRAEVPGVPADAIELKLDGRTLTIAGEKPRAFDEQPDQVLHREAGFGAFRRVLEFPLQVDGDSVVARHEQGVLYITVPKAQAARSRVIEIQREA